MSKGIPIIIIGGVLLLILLMNSFFVVQEGELGIRTRFKEIKETYDTAGVKFKVPFIDEIMMYSKKIQPWDGDSQRLPTQENQFVWVDTTARWKISDVKRFYERVGDIRTAQQRLDQVVDSSVRTVIAKNLLREAIRNSNVINEIKRENVFGEGGENDADDQLISTFTDTKYEIVRIGRSKLSAEMLEESRKLTPDYGIDLIDLIIRQIKYSDDLTQSVYNRMIKERTQIAQAFRSAGEGEKAKWLGQMEKELQIIRSDAERQAKEIKAKADAIALEIRNAEYSKDTSFAEYWMALVEYQKLLPKMKKIFTTDFDFFKYLHNKSGN